MNGKIIFTAIAFDGNITAEATGDFKSYKCKCVAVKVEDIENGNVIAISGLLESFGYSPAWRPYNEGGDRMLFITGKRNEDSTRESLQPATITQIATLLNQVSQMIKDAPVII